MAHVSIVDEVAENAREAEDWTEDTGLVIAARAGDIRAFDELARRYRSAVWLTAWDVTKSQSLSDDVTQDALLTAFKALPTLQDCDRFGLWLRSIARHRALRLASAESRQVPEEKSSLDQLLLRHSRHLSAPQDRLCEHLWIQGEVQSLPSDLRHAVQLHYLEGWPLGRISSYYNIPLTTLKWRLHRARLQLKNSVSQAQENPIG